MKWQKKGIIGLLANPFILIALVILIAIIAFNLPSGKFLSILNPSVSFAGKNWVVEQRERTLCPIQGDISYEFENEFLVLKSSASGSQTCSSGVIFAITDITNDDEVLILLDGAGNANAGGSRATGSYYMVVSIVDANGNVIRQQRGIDADSRDKPTLSASFEPQIFSFKNNFDGTWSSIESFGIGDIFIKKETKAMIPPIKLILGSESHVGMPDGSASANGFSRFYNIVPKENGFALCKADEVLVDDVCQTLSSILLKNEEAIKESFDEKLARIEAELLAKNQGLTADIQLLNQRLAEQGVTQSQIDSLKTQITALENELKSDPNNQLIQSQLDELKSQDLAGKIASLELELEGTKQQLADVQAGDKTVVNVIEANEAIKEPNAVKKLWNRLIAFIKNLFK